MAQKKQPKNQSQKPAHTAPLMSKATAVWLLEHTKLKPEQIARSCGLHVLELNMLAHDALQGESPILNGQLSEVEIERCEKDASATLHFEDPLKGLKPFQKKARRYTPIAYRADRPKAILWLLKNYPSLKDAHIMRLLATTQKTIQAVREGIHPLSQELQPHNPVLLGLCTEEQLQDVIAKVVPDEKGEPAKHVTAEGETLDPSLEKSPEKAFLEDISPGSLSHKTDDIGGENR